jgi:hypothetical protein
MSINPLNIWPFKQKQVDLGPFSGIPIPPEDWLRMFVTVLFSVALVTFLGVYLYDAVTIQGNGTWAQAKEAFGVILPALTGTLGTVIGFYFGNRTKPQQVVSRNREPSCSATPPLLCDAA